MEKEKFNVMRDGDQLLEHSTRGSHDYGTSRKSVEGIIAQGKVPILEMDMHVSLLYDLQISITNYCGREYNS